jgi:hypothetical protein
VDEAAVALGGFASEGWLGEEHGSAGFGGLGAAVAALVALVVHLVRDGGGAADVAESEDFDFVLSGFVLDEELVADFEVTGWLCRLAVAEDVAGIAGGRCEGSRFEEACGPQPFVDADSCAAVGHSFHRISAAGVGYAPVVAPSLKVARTIKPESIRRERRSQLRGLLLLALIIFLFVLYRARPLHLFHAGWWRP